MVNVPLVLVVAVSLYTGAAAVTDLRTHRIPNWLTVPTAVLGFLYHAVAPQGWGIVASLAGFALGFVLLLAPWLLGGGGMGDVKLLAALGAWLGPKWLLVAFLVSVFLAALLMALVLAWTTFRHGFATARKKLEKSRTVRRGPERVRGKPFLPLAVPVAAGTWSVLAWMFVNSPLH